MTSTDNLFRKPSSILTGSKRKFAESPPSSSYKSAKTTTNGSPRAAIVEDDNVEVVAGPELPTENGVLPEEEVDDDKEGRFFGSGVSADTRNALDYVAGLDGEEEMVEELVDRAWLRRMAVGFEKRITRNAELRSRFEGEPEKYVGWLLSSLNFRTFLLLWTTFHQSETDTFYN